MITAAHIKEYINFLHLKKYSAPATDDLKARWSALRDDEIPQQLRGLYLHWGIDDATARNYEQSFLQFQQGNNSATPQQPNYNNYQAPPTYTPPAPQQQQYNTAPIPEPGKGKSRTGLYVGIIAVLLVACGFMFYKMSEAPKDDAPATTRNGNNTTASQPEKKEVPQTAVAPETTQAAPAVSSVSAEEKAEIRMNVVRSLIDAEESRDIRRILNCFAPNMQQYWDVSNPSRAELERRYNNTWKISSNNNNIDVNIVRVSDNVYDMYSVYEYYSHKDGLDKSVNTHVRYVFDNNNKIVKTFGVK